jgi:hypothetical protein
VVLAIFVTTAASAVALGSCEGAPDGPETPADVLERGGSIARVTIGADAYDFEVSCYDAGAGSIIAVGTGTSVDAATGVERDTRVLVQAFLGDPYIGITVEVPPSGSDGETTAREEVFEASLDDSIDLLLEDDVIAADGIEFVRNLDLTQSGGVGRRRIGSGHLQRLRAGRAARAGTLSDRRQVQGAADCTSAARPARNDVIVVPSVSNTTR